MGGGVALCIKVEGCGFCSTLHHNCRGLNCMSAEPHRTCAPPRRSILDAHCIFAMFVAYQRRWLISPCVCCLVNDWHCNSCVPVHQFCLYLQKALSASTIRLQFRFFIIALHRHMRSTCAHAQWRPYLSPPPLFSCISIDASTWSFIVCRVLVTVSVEESRDLQKVVPSLLIVARYMFVDWSCAFVCV